MDMTPTELTRKLQAADVEAEHWHTSRTIDADDRHSTDNYNRSQLITLTAALPYLCVLLSCWENILNA